jgi:serine/threonine protein kinase
MNHEDMQQSAPDEEDIVMDREHTVDDLDRLILCTLGSLPFDLEESGAPSAPGEKEENERLLQRLGDPREFVDRALSREPAETVAWRTEQDGVQTVPDSGSPIDVTVNCNALGLLDLTDAYTAWQAKERVGWTCEYRVLKEIGRGGQGIVYLIELLDDFSGKRTVKTGKRALKVLSPARYTSVEDYRADMLRMAEVAAMVDQSWHNNLLQFERFEPHSGIYFMVMRLVDGYDLERLLARESVCDLADKLTLEEWDDFGPVVFRTSSSQRGRLQPGVAVNIIQQCLRGVSALHDKNIIHCDIKPSNIMIDSYGAIRLIDFCSAYHLSSPPSRRAWTPRYAPAEVLLGGEGTPQSDLASLGFVLIEFLTGRPDVLVASPGDNSLLANESLELDSVYDLDQKTRAELAEIKRRLPDRLTDLIPSQVRDSDRLIRLCRKLIAPNPAERFSDADEAISDGTHEFQSELHNAKPKLAVFYAEYMERWVKGMKRTEAASEPIK